MDSSRYVEVCDLPYCSEPDLRYWQRMKVGLRVRVLREAACRLFRKPNDELTVRDPKMAFLKMYPIKVNLGGDDHEVTVKKLNGLSRALRPSEYSFFYHISKRLSNLRERCIEQVQT